MKWNILSHWNNVSYHYDNHLGPVCVCSKGFPEQKQLFTNPVPKAIHFQKVVKAVQISVNVKFG